MRGKQKKATPFLTIITLTLLLSGSALGTNVEQTDLDALYTRLKVPDLGLKTDATLNDMAKALYKVDKQKGADITLTLLYSGYLAFNDPLANYINDNIFIQITTATTTTTNTGNTENTNTNTEGAGGTTDTGSTSNTGNTGSTGSNTNNGGTSSTTNTGSTGSTSNTGNTNTNTNTGAGNAGGTESTGSTSTTTNTNTNEALSILEELEAAVEELEEENPELVQAIIEQKDTTNTLRDLNLLTNRLNIEEGITKEEATRDFIPKPEGTEGEETTYEPYEKSTDIEQKDLRAKKSFFERILSFFGIR